MQIKSLAILLLLAVLPLGAVPVDDLLPEWKNAVPVKGKVRLRHWRFNDWGKRPKAGMKSGRSSTVSALSGKVRVTLENTHIKSVNMLYRSYKLSGGKAKRYRLKAVMSNEAERKALVRLQMTAAGGRRNVSKSVFFAVSGEAVQRELVMTVPGDSKSLQLTLVLSGAGKVTFSDVQLSAVDLASDPAPFQIVLPQEICTLPERTPVVFPVSLGPGRKLVPGETVIITLPWGVRLISTSRGVRIEKVAVKVKENTVYRLVCNYKNYSVPGFYLLLGSDLAGSGEVLNGSVQLEGKGKKSEVRYFQIRTVRDLPAVPPRYFKIALPVSDHLMPHESSAAVDHAQIRSGANVLLGSRLTASPRQLKTARIRQWVPVHISSTRAQQHCYYNMIRNESFWEKYYIPALHRQVLRYGSKRPEALIFDAFLGQQRSVGCLCALCRMELADFAPKIPKNSVKYSSSGLLAARYPRELANFRNARLNALWAGASVHLPLDGRGFSRRPALIPLYSCYQVIFGKTILKSAEAVIEYRRGLSFPEGEKIDPAVNFAIASRLCQDFRRKGYRGRMTAKFTPSAGISQEDLEFDLLNLFFSGFSGVWINLPPGADYRQRIAAAKTAQCLREYETFFRRKPLQKHKWELTSTAPQLELPPVAGPALYPFELPRYFPAAKLMVWNNSRSVLVGMANFTDAPLRCRLSSSEIPLRATGTIEGRSVNGRKLREKGVEVILPPRCWRFAKFENL